VREGDLVRVVLTNQLPVPTTIHWHGIDVPNAMDGVPGLTQEAVEPGETFVYEFPATNPGTRIYHSHQDVNAQMELGLYGALIVEHLDDPNGSFERDYTILLDEKALDFTPDVALGKAPLRNVESGNGRGGAFDFDLFLMNGKAGTEIPPIELAEGERVRLRLVNVGHLLHSMHTHGHSFKIIATDGNPVPPAAQWIKDTVTLGPGERYDIEFVGHNPGVWLFHCHMPNHGENGMMTTMVYEGVAPPVAGGAVIHGGHSGAPPAGPAAPGGSNPPAAPESGAPAFEVAVLDNRFEPRTLTVATGSTVTWRSRGINLHTSTALDGRWDSGNLAPGQSFSFTFTQPGTYRYFCRQHATQGQLATVVVQ
jgi:FtsP/CotA-like multicopper oxidase with cupredoxin domain